VPAVRDPLVGRAAEQATLVAHLRLLQEARPPGVVLIEGEAGIGKSRLVEDLIQRTLDGGVTVLSGGGDAIQRAGAYHAWRNVFGQVLGTLALGDPEARRARVLEYLVREPELLRLAPLLNAV